MCDVSFLGIISFWRTSKWKEVNKRFFNSVKNLSKLNHSIGGETGLFLLFPVLSSEMPSSTMDLFSSIKQLMHFLMIVFVFRGWLTHTPVILHTNSSSRERNRCVPVLPLLASLENQTGSQNQLYWVTGVFLLVIHWTFSRVQSTFSLKRGQHSVPLTQIADTSARN